MAEAWQSNHKLGEAGRRPVGMRQAGRQAGRHEAVAHSRAGW